MRIDRWYGSHKLVGLVVIAVVAATVLVWQSRDSTDPELAATGMNDNLWGTWELIEATASHEVLTHDALGPLTWTITRGPNCEVKSAGCKVAVFEGNDGCNLFTRDARLTPDSIIWGDQWKSTLVGCTGGFYDAMSTVMASPEVRLKMSVENLVFHAGAVTLTFNRAA